MNQEEQLAKCLDFILQRTALSKAKYPFPTVEEPEPGEEPEYSAKALAAHEAIKEAEFGCQESAVRKLVEVLLEQKLPEKKPDSPLPFTPGPDLEILPYSALVVDGDPDSTDGPDIFLGWLDGGYHYLYKNGSTETIMYIEDMETFRYATEEEIRELFEDPDNELATTIFLQASAEEALLEMLKEE